MRNYLDRKFLNRPDEKSYWAPGYHYSIFHRSEIQGLNDQLSLPKIAAVDCVSPFRSNMKEKVFCGKNVCTFVERIRISCVD